MVRIFLILSLAVALAGVVVSFVLREKVGALSEERTRFLGERDAAKADATQARSAERKARDAEKAARDELEVTKEELTSTQTRLNETEGTLARRSQELQDTISARDTAQRELARWKALGIEADQIATLQADARRMKAERDAFAEEKKVMGREIARLNDELDRYRGPSTEVQMPDVHGNVSSVNSAFNFVVLNVGANEGLKPNGKMIITRDNSLVAKVQLVRVDPDSAVANLLPDWTQGEVQAGDKVMTSYEALTR